MLVPKAESDTDKVKFATVFHEVHPTHGRDRDATGVELILHTKPGEVFRLVEQFTLGPDPYEERKAWTNEDVANYANGLQIETT